VGRAVLTATDAAAARTAIGISLYASDGDAILVARLDDDSGTPALRVTPGGVTVALTGSAWSYRAGGVQSGRYGLLRSDGAAADRLTLSGLSVNTATTDFTLTCRVQPFQAPSTAWYGLGIWSDSTNNPTDGVGVGINAGGGIFTIPRRGGSDSTSSNLPASPHVEQVWALVWVRASSQVKFYIDGGLVGPVSLGGNLGTLTAIVLGTVRDRTLAAPGIFRDLRLFATALTQSQIAAL